MLRDTIIINQLHDNTNTMLTQL